MFQRYGLIAVLVWVVGGAMACSSKSADSPPQADLPAGEVVEVSGAVIAEASVAGQVSTRRLAVGDTVTGAETIITGADGTVAIRLYHNQARWTLAAGKRRRVNQSAAWSAPKGGSGDLLARTDSDETAVAGRHAEREAAGTAATALAEARSEPEPEEKRVTSKKKRKQELEREVSREITTILGSAGEGEGGAVADVLSAGDSGRDLDEALQGVGGLSTSGRGGGGGTVSRGGIGTIGSGSGATRSGESPTSGKVSFAALAVEGLDRAQVARLMRKSTNQFRYCYDLELEKNPQLAGAVTATIIVDATGRATSVEVSGDSALDVVRACLKSKLRRLKYPLPTAESGRIEQRLVFKSE